MTPLHEVLERRFGVDEDAFAVALVAFADRVAGPLPLVDIRPIDYLGESQRAILRDLGASLEAVQADELGPVAALAAAYADLVTTSLSVAGVAMLLAVDSSRVRQRIYAGSLYAFKHRGGWRVPAFQIDGHTVLTGIDAVVARLPGTLHPVAVSRWFRSPNGDLVVGGSPVSPRAWLASGGSPDLAAALAEAIDQL